MLRGIGDGGEEVLGAGVVLILHLYPSLRDHPGVGWPLIALTSLALFLRP